MKRVLLIALLMMSITASAFAAGSCVVDSSHSTSDKYWRDYTCTADAAAATFPAITLSGFTGYYLYTVETWPGSTAPTDASDFTLTDQAGEDLMGANGTDGIDATTKFTMIPKSTRASVSLSHVVHDNMILNITGNAVNSAIIKFRITGVN